MPNIFSATGLKPVHISVFIAAMVLILLTSPAQALFTSPDRLIIESGQRSAEVVVSNQSDRPVVVRFEWERIIVDSQGKMQRIGMDETYEGYKPADPFLRYSPRQVILQPKQHQKVRVLVRRTDDIEEGEYHSHLLIKEEPIKEKTGPGAAQRDGVVRGQLDILVYRSVPVLLRHGETTLDFTVNEARIIQNDKGKPALALDITNNSTRTAYPNPTFNCKTASGEVITRRLLAVRLYTEVRQLNTEVPIPQNFDASQCTDLTVSFIDRKDFEFKNQPITQASVIR